MADLLSEIADRLIHDYDFKLSKGGKKLEKGVCPSCGNKSLWAYADSPWVTRCNHLNNCGWEGHAKELYPELFESWSKRFQEPERAKPVEQQNPRAAAQAYLRLGRGFTDPTIMSLIDGCYTQESHYDRHADRGRGAASATVRFAIPNTDSWWERLIDQPERFGDKKAVFKPGGSYSGHWWAMPGLSFDAPAPTAATQDNTTAIAAAFERLERAMDLSKPIEDEPAPSMPAAPAFMQCPHDLWLVEGIFDAIALAHHGIAAVSLMSCVNYPEHCLAALAAQIDRQGGQVKRPRLVFALDGDRAGQDYTRKWVQRARADGWVCTAATIEQRGRKKVDWNDLHLRHAANAEEAELQHRQPFSEESIKTYFYDGALLIAKSAMDVALLMYNHKGLTSFYFEHGNQLWWFKLDMDAYRKAMETIESDVEKGHRAYTTDDEKREAALRESGSLTRVCNCGFKVLYFQRHELTKESAYYVRFVRAHDGVAVKTDLKGSDISTAQAFKLVLLNTVAGGFFSGSQGQLDAIIAHQTSHLKTVQAVDFTGYSPTHDLFILGQLAVKDGMVIRANEEDFFEVGPISVKTVQRTWALQATDAPHDARAWFSSLWSAYGVRGYIALAFWLGSLFATQIRKAQQSFPFLELVGEPGTGKTTLLKFLWKLLGRADYEGINMSKSSAAGRMREFSQFSNLPVVVIENDREVEAPTGNRIQTTFHWDELKDSYNGNPIRTIGVKTGGNETYSPPFRGAIVIGQNTPVRGSDAMMERICHIGFTKDALTVDGREAGLALERMRVEDLGSFIIGALKLQQQVLEHVTGKYDERYAKLSAQAGLTHQRVTHNHTQLLLLAEALAGVLDKMGVQVPKEDVSAVRAEIARMALQRQETLAADSPLVAEFWDTFDYLNEMAVETLQGSLDYGPWLDHSRDPACIAVNLNQFEQRARDKGQRIPPLSELKRVLKTSRLRPFVDIKGVNSAIHARRDKGGLSESRTVHCWVFKKGASK